MCIQVVGIDCSAAKDGKKVGLAWSRDSTSVQISSVGTAKGVSGTVEWIQENFGRSEPVLFALDAPLGWPSSLGPALSRHNAGSPFDQDSETLFSRCTDRYVYKEIFQDKGLRPFAVGADKIAKTAHFALDLLRKLREEFGKDIPLVSDGNPIGESIDDVWGAVEVYPRATLETLGVRSDGYKTGENAKPNREEVVRSLSSNDHVGLTVEMKNRMVESDDVLDAVVCVMAGRHFLDNECLSPLTEHTDKARKEGWIWVKRRAEQGQ